MTDEKKRKDDKPAMTELDDGELEQVQGGGLRASSSLDTRLQKVKSSKIRTGSKKLDFDGNNAVP